MVDSKLHKNWGSEWNLNAWFKCLLLQTPPLQSDKNNCDIVKHYGQWSLYRNKISLWKVDLLCSAHQKWAVSSLSVPTFLGFFWRQFSNVGVLVQWGSLQDKVRVGCLPLFLGTFPLTVKTGQGIDLTLSQMPLSDCHFKAELPLLWCVWIAQRECRYSYLVLEKMILENDCLCMKQSVPQARALNKYSKDVRASMFSAASKITFLMSYLLLLH